MTSLLLLVVLNHLPHAEPPCPAGGEVIPCAWREDGKGYVPQVGDLIFFRKDWLPTNVLYYVPLFGGPTHVGLIVSKPDGTLALLETPTIGSEVEFCDIFDRLQCYKGRMWVRRRCKPVTKEQSEWLTAFACAQHGKPYDFCGLLAWPICPPVRLLPLGSLSEKDLNPRRWFCSSLVCAACVSAGLLDAEVVLPHSTFPADLMNDLWLDLSPSWEKAIRLSPLDQDQP